MFSVCLSSWTDCEVTVSGWWWIWTLSCSFSTCFCRFDCLNLLSLSVVLKLSKSRVSVVLLSACFLSSLTNTYCSHNVSISPQVCCKVLNPILLHMQSAVSVELKDFVLPLSEAIRTICSKVRSWQQVARSNFLVHLHRLDYMWPAWWEASNQDSAISSGCFCIKWNNCKDLTSWRSWNETASLWGFELLQSNQSTNWIWFALLVWHFFKKKTLAL